MLSIAPDGIIGATFDPPTPRGHAIDPSSPRAIALRDAFIAACTGRPWSFPLAPAGTPFQLQVWQALAQIPTGTTVSYTQLAECIATRSATRAVATAIAANPIAVLVPCHRVIGSDGRLHGYRWGLERKRALLAAEGAILL